MGPIHEKGVRMKVGIITIAGLSSRFNEGIKEDQHKLKAIYHEGSARNTLLYHMLARLDTMDRVVLVAGYKKEDLLQYIDEVLPVEMKAKISVITNDHYDDWSSGYSLFLGIEEALKYEPESIIFAEGDLDIDDDSFARVVASDKNVVTCNHELIRSNKAVIGYCNEKGQYKYAFSVTHGLVEIDEPFELLFNSGQIWKFNNMEHLQEAYEAFFKSKESGTNLLIIADYFSKEVRDNIELLEFNTWVNCNTRDDYRCILKHWEVEE